MPRGFNARWYGVGCALGSAGLFGVTTPIAKILSPEVPPLLLAGLLYLGSGVGLLVLWALRRWSERPNIEPGLKRREVPRLILIIAFGGVLGPILLMWGLTKTAASTTSLLLNLEGVFTALLAWFVFKENFDRRIMLGMGLISAGGVCVTWLGPPQIGFPWGAMAVGGACLAWAIDNNLTRGLSGTNSIQIAMVKGLAAGVVNVALAFGFRAGFPSLPIVLGTAFLGFAGYGISLVLFITALRHLGAARTGAYFSTAPFIGAAASLPLLGEHPKAGLFVAAGLMLAGVWLHLTERHEHQHRHEVLEHEHVHVHDEHHQHTHHPGDPPGEPHSHRHLHEQLVHSHPHFPDLHHRHQH